MLEPLVPSVPSLFPPGWKERAEAVSSGEDAEVVDHELPVGLLSDVEAEIPPVGAVLGVHGGGPPGDDEGRLEVGSPPGPARQDALSEVWYGNA